MIALVLSIIFLKKTLHFYCCPDSQYLNIMMTLWRKVGISYVKYLNQCSKTLRDAVRTEARSKLFKENPDSVTLSFRTWKDGKKENMGM